MTLLEPGTLLIAPPAIPDERFRDAVLLITHHYKSGAFALTLNIPSAHTMQDLLDELEIDSELDWPIYWGGPVATNTVWMLHSTEWEMENTVVLSDQWSMTSNVEMFHHMADGDHPREFRIMMGYTSWARGQLEAELRGRDPWSPRHSWLTVSPQTPDWVFNQPPEELWDRATEQSAHEAVGTWL